MNQILKLLLDLATKNSDVLAKKIATFLDRFKTTPLVYTLISALIVGLNYFLTNFDFNTSDIVEQVIHVVSLIVMYILNSRTTMFMEKPKVEVIKKPVTAADTEKKKKKITGK